MGSVVSSLMTHATSWNASADDMAVVEISDGAGDAETSTVGCTALFSCVATYQRNQQTVAAQRIKSQQFDKLFEAQRKLNKGLIKMLLLGGPASGKTTIAKQMQIIHNGGFPKEQLCFFQRLIHSNIIDAVEGLLKACADLEIYTRSISHDVYCMKERVSMMSTDALCIDAVLAANIDRIWRSQPIQQCYARRHTLNLPESTAYYLNKVVDICQPDYTPSNQDILRARAPTIGMNVTEFRYQQLRFR